METPIDQGPSPVAEKTYTIGPLPPDCPPGLEEQIEEWSARFVQSLFHDIHHYLRLLGSLPLPKFIEAQARNKRLSITLTVHFERGE
jgi:hypothetical protein